MKIIDILNKKGTVSFEFYPPKTEAGIPAVFRSISRLAAFNPDFISVTYGAGGTTRAYTEEIAVRAKDETDLTVMAHITCAAQSKEEIRNVLNRFESAGIENLIALRGDPPAGQEKFVPVDGGFAYSTDLMKFIKANFNFRLAGSCYPEGHVESDNLDLDIEHTKWKVDAGAEFLITQLFFDNNDLYDFVDRARKAGINVPIVAGILPILSTTQTRRITKMCGAKIPDALNQELEKYIEDDDSARNLGIEYATNQVSELWDYGIQGVHFYALNRSHSIVRILKNLNLSTQNRGE